MKRGKKGQSANEAALITTFLTFFMIVAIAAVSDDIIQASDNNYRALLQDLADVIESEANIAFGSENGYFHQFTLPQTLNGQPYAVGIINSSSLGDQVNTTIIFVSSARPNVRLNVTRLLPRDVVGNLGIGPNTVRKEQGIVILRSLPLFAPAVLAANPSSGPVGGGTIVTITGSDFVATPTVNFGGAAFASPLVTFLSSTQLTAVSPAHAAGVVDVVVTNPDGQSGTLVNGFKYVPPPTVLSASPSSGATAGGTIVTIAGSDFVNKPTVAFGGVVSPLVTFVSSTQLTAVSPAHAAGAVDVVVTNPDAQFGTLVNGFKYVLPPTVLSANPSSGPVGGGTIVTITGSDFVNKPTVAFGGVVSPLVTFLSSTQLTAVSPAHAAGVVDVVVTNPDGQSGTLVNGFTYMPPPTVLSANPSSGTTAGGNSVTVSGTGFVNGAGLIVSFGGVASPSVTWDSDSLLTAVTPAHAAGAVDVVVTNPDAQFGTLVKGFKYVPPPTVTSFSPGIGPFTGGTIVTITGSDFVNKPTVAFGGVVSPLVTFVSSTQLTAVTPASVVGYVTVRVTNPDGQSASAPSQFLYRLSLVPIGTVFVTSPTYNGNLGGLSGADAICQARADLGSFGGTWKAWLSTSTVNAKTRITDIAYRRLDNALVATNLADLTDGSIANPINVTDSGSMLSGAQFVWTGTTAAGIYLGGNPNLYSCSDWISPLNTILGSFGFTSSTTSWWTRVLQLNCDRVARLYCFKTG